MPTANTLSGCYPHSTYYSAGYLIVAKALVVGWLLNIRHSPVGKQAFATTQEKLKQRPFAAILKPKRVLGQSIVEKKGVSREANIKCEL